MSLFNRLADLGSEEAPRWRLRPAARFEPTSSPGPAWGPAPGPTPSPALGPIPGLRGSRSLGDRIGRPGGVDDGAGAGTTQGSAGPAAGPAVGPRRHEPTGQSGQARQSGPSADETTPIGPGGASAGDAPAPGTAPSPLPGTGDVPALGAARTLGGEWTLDAGRSALGGPAAEVRPAAAASGAGYGPGPDHAVSASRSPGDARRRSAQTAIPGVPRSSSGPGEWPPTTAEGRTGPAEVRPPGAHADRDRRSATAGAASPVLGNRGAVDAEVSRAVEAAMDRLAPHVRPQPQRDPDPPRGRAADVGPGPATVTEEQVEAAVRAELDRRRLRGDARIEVGAVETPGLPADATAPDPAGPPEVHVHVARVQVLSQPAARDRRTRGVRDGTRGAAGTGGPGESALTAFLRERDRSSR